MTIAPDVYGFRRAGSGKKAQQKFVIVSLALAAALLAITIFAISMIVDVAGRIFLEETPEDAQITGFDMEGARTIKRLERFWDSPAQ
jgi:hypothetical protein